MGTQHEVSGFYATFSFRLHGLQYSLTILHTAKCGTRDNGVGHFYVCLFQHTQRCQERRLQETTHTTGFHGRNEFLDLFQVFVIVYFRLGYDFYVLIGKFRKLPMRIPGYNKRGVIATKPKRVAHDSVYFRVFFSKRWHKVRHGIAPMKIGGNEMIFHGQQTDDCLDTSRCRRGMSRECLRTGYRWHILTKYSFQGSDFCLVIIWCTSSMCVHVIYIPSGQGCHIQCQGHGPECSFPIR